jgi:hypothetical protein
MPSHGIQESDLSTTQTEVDTILSFSDESLSTSLFELGLKIGERFAKKNCKDVEVYQAEALFVLTVICKIPTERFLQIKDNPNPLAIDSLELLIRKVYRELYKYMYADRVVSASHMTVWRHERDGKQVVTASSLSVKVKDNKDKETKIDCPQKGCTEIEMLELYDEVAKSTQEREYIQMTLKGADEEEIAHHLGICKRVVNQMRARIVKRLKKQGKKDVNITPITLPVESEPSDAQIVCGAD